MYMQENIQCYLNEKEKREKRLEIYAEKIQEIVLNRSEETIRELVKERHNQKMTQQEISDITGINHRIWLDLKMAGEFRP